MSKPYKDTPYHESHIEVESANRSNHLSTGTKTLYKSAALAAHFFVAGDVDLVEQIIFGVGVFGVQVSTSISTYSSGIVKYYLFAY